MPTINSVQSHGPRQGREDVSSHSVNEAVQSYVYKPLEALPGLEYRLLVLHPLKASRESVTCSLIHKSLREIPVPEYETVSYVWGDATERATILVDEKVLLVPASSERVLQRLALPDKDRIIWLDAVCINQSDLEERTRQVLFMRFLYRNSAGNVVFLADGDEISARAISNILEIHEEIAVETDQFQKMEERIMREHGWVYASEEMKVMPDVEALIAFYSHPYFSRVWVVQEVLLASENICICGDMEFPFIAIVRVAVWLHNYHAFHIPSSLHGTPGLGNAARLWESMGKVIASMRPESTLIVASGRYSTDQRDKIFGMLGVISLPAGLSAGEVPALLRPSYTKPVHEVFRDAVRYSLQTHRCLRTLRNPSHRSEDDLNSGFPTWVPRFDRKRGHDKDPTLLSFEYRLPGGMKGSANVQFARVPEGGDLNDLILSGLVIDEIAAVFPIFGEEDTSIFWRVCFDLSDRKPQYKHRLAKTLIADRNYQYQKVSQEDFELGEDWKAHFHSGPGDKLPAVTRITPETPDKVKRAVYFGHAVMNATTRRRFAFVKKGSSAVVPKLAQPGDVITLMDAGDCPVVLRPVGDKWLMLGECYLEDNMESQAMDLGLPEREFCIR